MKYMIRTATFALALMAGGLGCDAEPEPWDTDAGEEDSDGDEGADFRSLFDYCDHEQHICQIGCNVYLPQFPTDYSVCMDECDIIWEQCFFQWEGGCFDDRDCAFGETCSGGRCLLVPPDY